MPLYEYECEACGHRFEVIQKFSDAPIEKCPVCGSAVHKLQSAPAFQFKGTGWYVTDYAKSGSSPEAKGGRDKDKDAKEAKDGKEGADARKTDSTSSDKPASANSGSTSTSGSTTASSTPAPKSDSQK